MIAMQLEDGSIRSVYSHWDGYLSHNGKILLENYSDPKKVEALLNEGNISSLGENIGEKHDFNGDRPEGQTTFYMRDRGESNQEAVVAKNEKKFWKDMDGGFCEFFYLFRDGKWLYSEGEKNFKELTAEACKEVVE